MTNLASTRKTQTGAALMMVLWVALFLSLLLATALAITRIEARITAADLERLKAEEAAKGGMVLAMYRLSTDRRQRQDSLLPLTTQIGDYRVTVEFSREMEKLDINLASEQALADYLVQFVDKPEQAIILAAQIADWRDTDDLVRVNGAERRDYARSRDGRKPGNRNFLSVGELIKVLDMKGEVLACAGSGLTVFGSAGRANSQSRSGKQFNINAGGRVTLQAMAVREEAGQAIVSMAGAYLITGNRQKPFELIALRVGVRTDLTNCDRSSS